MRPEREATGTQPLSRLEAEPGPLPWSRGEYCRAAALGLSSLSVACPGWWERGSEHPVGWEEQRGSGMRLNSLAGQ